MLRRVSTITIPILFLTREHGFEQGGAGAFAARVLEQRRVLASPRERRKKNRKNGRRKEEGEGEENNVPSHRERFIVNAWVVVVESTSRVDFLT